MAIITISINDFSKGSDVTREVAKRLGYRTVSHEIISEAAQVFQVPQANIEWALRTAPSIFERFFSKKQKYITYITAQVLSQFRGDNLIYQDPAGHLLSRCISPIKAITLAYFRMNHFEYGGLKVAEEYYAKTIPHLFNVRIVTSIEDRIRFLLMDKGLNRKQALKLIKKKDSAHVAWCRHFYGVDDSTAGAYDLVIHLSKLSVDDVADLICDTVNKPKFKASPASQQIAEDLALASAIKAALFNEHPDCEVVADKNFVEVYARFTEYTDTSLSEKIKEKVLKIPGVTSVSVILIPSALFT